MNTLTLNVIDMKKTKISILMLILLIICGCSSPSLKKYFHENKNIIEDIAVAIFIYEFSGYKEDRLEINLYTGKKRASVKISTKLKNVNVFHNPESRNFAYIDFEKIISKNKVVVYNSGTYGKVFFTLIFMNDNWVVVDRKLGSVY